jgi:glycosyltransferase involved in cell wall biosynthesis
MRIYYSHTESRNGGFSVLGKGIRRELLKAGHELVDSNPEVCLTYGIPDQAEIARKKFPNVPLLYYTVWESSIYPDTYIQAINNAKVDLVLTATKFTQWTLSRAGIDAKVWWHGIDDRWEYKPRRDDGVFTFLHYNAYEWRKGWEIVLGAFLEEFKEDEPVKLILKARERENADYLLPITMDKSESLPFSNVEEILGHISDEAMVDMLERADCGVFPVRGEGWFLPATECVAQGIPVIMPNVCSMSEQWGTGYFDCGIDGYINASPRYPGYMIQPSLKGVRKQMRYCFENEKEVRELAKKGSEEVFKKFDWQKIIRDLEEYIKLAKENYVSNK